MATTQGGRSARSVASRVRDRLRSYGTVPSGPTAQIRKPRSARSIASMPIFVVVGAPSARFPWNRHGIRDAVGWGHPPYQYRRPRTEICGGPHQPPGSAGRNSKLGENVEAFRLAVSLRTATAIRRPPVRHRPGVSHGAPTRRTGRTAAPSRRRIAAGRSRRPRRRAEDGDLRARSVEPPDEIELGACGDRVGGDEGGGPGLGQDLQKQVQRRRVQPRLVGVH